MSRAGSFLAQHRVGAVVATMALTFGAVGVAVIVPSGSSSGSPDGSTSHDAPPSTAAEIIIVCESGTADQDGVETSSEVVTRAPAGSPIPPGCRTG